MERKSEYDIALYILYNCMLGVLLSKQSHTLIVKGEKTMARML